jgi:hypothetical protein
LRKEWRFSQKTYGDQDVVRCQLIVLSGGRQYTRVRFGLERDRPGVLTEREINPLLSIVYEPYGQPPAGACCVHCAHTTPRTCVVVAVAATVAQEEGIPLAPDTLVRLYSMSKPLVSAATMILYEQVSATTFFAIYI